MQISVSTRHGQLSKKRQVEIVAKVEKLSRYFERLTAIEVTVDLEHPETPGVDLRVSAEHKHDFLATDRSHSVMGAVDQVVHKMEGQLRKYKEKIQSRHRTASDRHHETSADSEAE